jgi:hypothetical protein
MTDHIQYNYEERRKRERRAEMYVKQEMSFSEQEARVKWWTPKLRYVRGRVSPGNIRVVGAIVSSAARSKAVRKED